MQGKHIFFVLQWSTFQQYGKSCQLDCKPVFVDPHIYAQNGAGLAGLVSCSFFNRLAIPHLHKWLMLVSSLNLLDRCFLDTVSVAPALLYLLRFQCTVPNPAHDSGITHSQPLRYFAWCKIFCVHI